MSVGKFIVFEGLDGSGLSTQSFELRNFLINQGYKVVLTKEQTDGLIGGLIKSCLKKEWKTSLLTLQILFTSDRAHHLDTEIEPGIAEGKIIISDRYFFSTIAFGGLQIEKDFLKRINSKFRVPDITFIMDCPPDVCLERIGKGRFHSELFEEKEKMEKIRQNYFGLAKEFPNVHIVDANRASGEIHKEIVSICESYGLGRTLRRLE
ncbi:MAG TPA: dTMP kinase [archaeon]|nr:dTMP kinase [archaeon]